MNIFKRLYCRTFQMVFKMLLPFLPYREPKLLKDYDELTDILLKAGKKRVLLVTDKGITNLNLTNSLNQNCKQKNIEVFLYDDTVANPTSKNVEDAVSIYRENNCDAIIGFGGGSAMDCAKAVGARIANPKKSLAQMRGILKVKHKLPMLIAIPTTAGTGSETTIAAVITDSETRQKYAINDFPLIPQYALLDPHLTIGLPKHITSTTGMDALTHAVEAYIGRSTTKRTRQESLDAIKLIFENLENAYNNGADLTARENMQKAAYLAGLAFTKSYVGYIHAIAHSLGGKYNVAHGLANAIIMPYVLKSYGKSVYKKLWQIGKFVHLFSDETSQRDGAEIFIAKIEKLNRDMNIPNLISEIQTADIPSLAKTAEKEANPLYPVPKLFTAKQLEEIYAEVKNGKSK